MENLSKRISSMFLAFILCFSLYIPTLAAQEQGESSESNPFGEINISELFSLLGHTDGAETEDLSYELYQAFEANPSEFISAATELQNEDLAKMADLLVYFAGCSDLDEFREKVVSCENNVLTEAEQSVIDELIQKLNLEQNKTIDVVPAEELPEVPEYNPIFLEKLISAHVDNNVLEDEEFFETLSKVFIDDPATFSDVLKETDIDAKDIIVDGVAKACVKSGRVLPQENKGKLTEEQAIIISAVQKQIAAVNSDVAEKAVLGGQETAIPMSTQVPTIGTMAYVGKLICGEATTLNVTFSETTATSSVRTYWTEVYAVRNGKEYLKSSKSLTIAKGSSSTTQSYSIIYSDTGVVYTLVKVYAAKRGSLLTQRQGTYSDTVTGPWSIIVTLPKDRNYKGSLSLYHANGALQKTCECLGLSESNGPMTVTNGNTPTGTYRGELYSKHSNTSSYGPYRRINMVGVSGIAKTSGRTGIMIHGGDPTTNTSLPGYPLRCTYGCIRVTNDNQKALVDLVDTLISDFYADTYGDVVVSES